MPTCMDNGAVEATDTAYYMACELMWHIYVVYRQMPVPPSIRKLLFDYVSIGMERIMEDHLWRWDGKEWVRA